MSDPIRVYQLRDLAMIISSGGFSVNGGAFIRHDYNQKYVVFQGEVSTLEYVATKDVTTGYVSADDEGETLTKEAHMLRRVELNTSVDDHWPTLEAEFAYRKFMDAWNPVTETVTTRTPLDFEVVSLEYDASDIPPYTVACRLEGAVPDGPNFGLFNYRPNRFQLCLAVAEAVEIAFSGASCQSGRFWSIPDHGKEKLEFIQVNGSYATSSRRSDIEGVGGITGTAKECMDRHNENLRLLREFWELQAAKLEPKPLSGIAATEALALAQAIKAKLNGIRPVEKSRMDLREVERQVALLVTRLELAARGVTE